LYEGDVGAATDFTGSNRGSLLGGGLPAPLLLLEELLVVIVTPIFPDSFDKTSALRFVRLMIGLSSLLLLSPSAISGGSATNLGGGGVTLVASVHPVMKFMKMKRLLLKCGLFLIPLQKLKQNEHWMFKRKKNLNVLIKTNISCKSTLLNTGFFSHISKHANFITECG
jgi:hypothetical protein